MPLGCTRLSHDGRKGLRSACLLHRVNRGSRYISGTDQSTAAPAAACPCRMAFMFGERNAGKSAIDYPVSQRKRSGPSKGRQARGAAHVVGCMGGR